MTMLLPATKDIRAVFEDEITNHGGTISDKFDDGSRLFLWSTFPKGLHVRPKDSVQRGVALRTKDNDVLIHPYVFRQVCRNGAIMPEAVDTRRIERLDFAAPADAIDGLLCQLREEVNVCFSDEAFSSTVDRMRTLAGAEATHAIHLMRVLSEMTSVTELPEQMVSGLLDSVMGRFEGERDRSMFGLMNAVTSVARDTRDPETRWRLEELGGGVVALLPTILDLDGAAALPVSEAVV